MSNHRSVKTILSHFAAVAPCVLTLPPFSTAILKPNLKKHAAASCTAALASAQSISGTSSFYYFHRAAIFGDD